MPATDTAEKVAQIIGQLGVPPGQTFLNVQDRKGAVQTQTYEESAQPLRKPASPRYPADWVFRKHRSAL